MSKGPASQVDEEVAASSALYMGHGMNVGPYYYMVTRLLR